MTSKHRRINIQIHDEIDPLTAVQRVEAVMRGGRVSGNGHHYCWVSTFTDGTAVVVRGPSDAIATSDSFVVYKEEGVKHEEENSSKATA